MPVCLFIVQLTARIPDWNLEVDSTDAEWAAVWWQPHCVVVVVVVVQDRISAITASKTHT
jgi:hypothetical protein